MAVKTKSIYEPALPGDGLRVLVTRYYPRGVKRGSFDEWVRALSPSRELLKRYRSGEVAWDAFKESFVAELRSSEESREEVWRLHARGESGDVTLLCYEKEGLPCHRHLVKQAIVRPSLLAEGGIFH